MLVGHGAQNPLTDDQLVGGIFERTGQEFDFVLFVVLAVHAEIAHFGVTVFDSAAAGSHSQHGFFTERFKLGVGRGFVVTALVVGLEERIFRSDHIVFEFAHTIELETCLFLHHFSGAAHHVGGVAFKGIAVFVVIGAEDIHGGDFGKRIQISRAVTRNHVQVARAGIQVLEKTRTVHTFPATQHGLEVIQVVDHKIEGL